MTVFQLPPAALAVLAVMLWPAIWAGGLAVGALAGDLARLRRTRHATIVRSD